MFDSSHGKRIDFNVAIEVQRKLIADYINNFRQGKYSRSSCSSIFFKIDVLKKFAIFTGKHLC